MQAINQLTFLFVDSKESNQLHVLLVARVRLMNTHYTYILIIGDEKAHQYSCMLVITSSACMQRSVVEVVVFIHYIRYIQCMHASLPASKAVPQSNTFRLQISTMNTLMHNEC